ncbi:MAG: DNA translocase FtsK 4TM domain-containing protein [Rickettsiaceae bacterium]|nr:DNA translocase FtsK 4TM domain-containing protein [Rickettsiaceae bacterium]MDP4832748.1 DNA translocase FtsK 4TM domain-containing protein [Rickettsiaceae bacterium]MDP5020864.1 DNA translocase FtsK 4TM domain-containing protein [Rickettsiaceae bacterium]MDP5082971.1 DNA translocase FtsK 4TM domain-containing protein [Rickettsiaceae bacterium]
MNYIKKTLTHSKTRALILLLLAIITGISLASYSPSDPSFNLVTDNIPSNLLLYLGSYTADLIYQIFGRAAFIFPLCATSWSYLLFRNGKVGYAFLRTISMLFAIICASGAFASLEIKLLPAGGGGVTGLAISHIILSFTQIVNYKELIIPGYIVLAIIFTILALGIPFRLYKLVVFVFFNTIIQVINKTGIFQKLGSKLNTFDTGDAYYAEGEFGSINQQNKVPFTEEAKVKKQSAPIVRKTRPIEQNTSEQNTLPPIDLLDEADTQSFKPQTQAELTERSEQLVSVLKDFGVKGQVIAALEGPVVTMYEFEPAAGTKSSRIIGLADDIARSLSAVSARIAVIPGRNAIGIELPNKKRMFFRLKELVTTSEFQDSHTSLPLILGKDLSGSPLVADLAKMPHLLVAGTTGSGKSVAINAMIMSLLYRYTPDECKMIMIDPKMLELSAYDNIPHLMTPVVTEPGKAVVALKWACKEMENRYRLMSHLGVRSIANYNVKIQEAAKAGKILERKVQTGFDPETGKPIHDTVPIDMNKMPFIVVIVDEMADLMLVAGKDIESSIQRLAQMARAAGIHLIMATQRPSVDVITGVIKANFPSRISFKVTSKIDSRTILGEQGAEQLLGMGDMLYMGNSAKILRVHGPFVDDKEVERVTNFLRDTGTPEYISAVTESEEDEMLNNEFENSGEDDMYTQAVNIVRTERKASISYIQRCLRIGYNRAANLVEEMEKNGILSSPNHSGKREILLPED